MEDLAAIVSTDGNFETSSHADKIRLFAWFIHERQARASFSAPDIAACFDHVHLRGPVNLHRALQALCESGDLLLASPRAYKLERAVRQRLSARHGSRDETVIVDRLLAGLPSQLSDRSQAEYLEEALLCFRSKAYRGAIVMTWNLVYDHLVAVIAANHLPAFNAAIPPVLPKARPVNVRDDFQRWKESDVVKVAYGASIVSKEVNKVLQEKLDHRNSAAHPSGSKYTKLEAEAFISSLVNNAMLKIR